MKKHLNPKHALLGTAIVIFLGALVLSILAAVTIGAVKVSLAEVPAVKNGKVMAINLTDVYGGGIRMVPSVEAMFSFMYE